MKTSKQRLLNHVLANDDYAAFRRTQYFQGLAHLRRLRWERRRRQLLALAACGLIAAGSLLYLGPRPAPPRSRTALGEVVHSVPLRADQVVADTDFSVEVVKTQLADSTPVSERFSYELVRTSNESGGLEFISDSQLFALFPGQPLALVPADEGGGKRLCFLDPKARVLSPEGGGNNNL